MSHKLTLSFRTIETFIHERCHFCWKIIVYPNFQFINHTLPYKIEIRY